MSLANRVRYFYDDVLFCHASTIGMHHTVGSVLTVGKQEYRDFITSLRLGDRVS